MTLASRVKALRLRSGKSLQEVADAIGSSKVHMWDIERGASKNPSYELLKKLADFYRVGVGTLVGEDPDAEKDPQMVALYRNLTELSEADRETIAMLVERMKKPKG
jgi:transcriptional regulator with XRE-family HTH domain